MRAQTLFLISLGAALIVPALAIHIGGVVAYLGAAGTFAGLAVLWRRAARADRQATIKAIRDAIGDPQPHQAGHEPYASAQD